jgi:ribosomal protein L10
VIAESGRRATVETKTGRTLVVEAAILDTAFERWYCGLTEAFDKLFDGEIVFVTGKLPGDIYACVEAFGDRYEIPQDKFVAAPQDARPQ